MCRLLGIASNGHLPAQYLREFRELADRGRTRVGASPGHRDGWGIVAYSDGNPMYLARETTSAKLDGKYEEVCRTIEERPTGGIVVAHLRKAASKKGVISIENTHPFVHGHYSFVHNGGIRSFQVRPRGLQGITDSERFFRLLMNIAEKRGALETAITDVITLVRSKYGYSSLNFILADGKGRKLYACRDCTSAQDYYSLFCKVSEEWIIFSSERLIDGGWISVPNRTLAVADEGMNVRMDAL